VELISLELSEKDIQLLVRLAYIGLTVLDETSDADRMDRECVIDQVLKVAHESKAIAGISYNRDLGGYFLDPIDEEKLLEDLGSFVETSFWNELPARLAQRDIRAALGTADIMKMNDAEIEKDLDSRERAYRSEFERNGITNVRILDTGSK
jgi:hypothetical protein